MQTRTDTLLLALLGLQAAFLALALIAFRRYRRDIDRLWQRLTRSGGIAG